MIRISTICIALFALALLDTEITVNLADVGGTWKICGLGADGMNIIQVGNHVYGTYNTPRGQGIIDGLVNAQNIWLGTWTEPFNDDWGYFSAEFSNDTSSVYGNWKYASSDYDMHDLYTPFNGYWDGGFQGKKVVAGNTTIDAPTSSLPYGPDGQIYGAQPSSSSPVT